MKILSNGQIAAIVISGILITGYCKTKNVDITNQDIQSPIIIGYPPATKQPIKPITEPIDTSVRNDMVDVQVLFAKNGYQYCEFYDEYKGWEAEANKMDDDYYQKHPDAPGVGAKKADKWLDMKVSRWLKKHHLPDSIGTTISIYGAKVCD